MSDDETRIQRLDDGANRRRGRAYLTILSGREVGTVFKLGPGSSILGRGNDADVQIIDEGVSRRHAKIVREFDGTTKIIDLNSTNGTYLNGRRIQIEALREGDRVRIGQSATLELRYEYLDSEDEDRVTEQTSPVVPTHRPMSTTSATSTSDGATAEAARGGGFDNLAATLDSLGKFYKTGRQYDHALQAYRRTLQIREESFGADHPSVASILDTMAGVLRTKGDFQEALEHQQRAVTIYEKRSGEVSPPEMAHMLTNLAECFLGLSRAEEAIDALQRALDLLESRNAQESELAPARFGMARALAKLGREPVRSRTLALMAKDGFAQATEGASRAKEVERWLAESA